MRRAALIAIAFACGCAFDWEPARTYVDSDATSDAATDGSDATTEVGDADVPCPPTVDLTSDPNNCGKCGVVCRSGYACVSKICGNVPMQLAAGKAHTCALLRDGSVVCWGANDRGQLGDGTTTSRSKPAPVKGLSGKPSQLAAEGDHTCARIGDKVFCWGSGKNGELGDGSTVDRSTPVQVAGLTGATSVIVGGTFTCAVRSTSHAACWGANDKGQLGDGTTTARPKIGAEVGTNKGTTEGIPFLSLSLGPAHACGRRSSGGIANWGDNSFSQSGWASPTTASFPNPTPGLPVDTGSMTYVTDASAIAAGGAHCCAARAAGIVICWGANDRGQLGNGLVEVGPGRKDYVEVGALPAVSPPTLVAGERHTCVRASSGKVYCWGRNDFGQLGRGTAGKDEPVAAAIALDDVIDLVAGDQHTCARLTTGDVACWGANAAGQLGDGTKTNRSKPVNVSW